ncbi:MAG TPA: single-stranded-DNA-specific exonuclease RecJ [Clostridiales bacterium]|nr:single-stranded-DNA-specific exonuclease RecJ [Clostridiales bacterium]
MAIYEMCAPLLENTETIAMLLQFDLNISEVTARLLVNRGVSSPAEARAFLNPSLDQLHDPFDLKGMAEAVHRIRQAINKKEKIVIYGDYDADGITSSSVLSLYLSSLGAITEIYIPSRQDEGYGIHLEALRSILENGAGLVITVDCGISAIEEVNEIQPLLDIIITDHHTPGNVLPNAYAVINPKIPGQAYPFKDLAGVGVTAKLVQALGGTEGLQPYLDIVAIGTIADIVPLIGENRVFASLGLKQINENPRPGISALLQVLELTGQPIDSAKVSFIIGPCLNAPGRMTTFHSGYNLLTSKSIEQALPSAIELAEQNRLRRETESLILESALKMIPNQVDLAHQRVIVVAGEGWHPGVIGIVASRIAEQYTRPAIVMSIDGDQAVGSARSIKGFHLYNAISHCSKLLTKFGGHEMAAGLSIKTADIDKFRSKICAYADEVLEDEALIPHYIYDGQLKPEQISANLLKEIEMLAPFGCGNPVPRFLLPSAVVENSRIIGKNANHLKLALSLGQRSWDAVGFGMAECEKDLQQGCRVSLLTSLKRNEWMGISSTQFQIHSMKRVYEGPRDLEELLGCFHSKFFDVFFHYFMYNYNDVLLDDSKTCDSSANDGQCSIETVLISLDEALDCLGSSMIGTAVFVNTFEAAAGLLLELLDRNLLDKFPVHYHQPNPANGLGRSTVILIPDLSVYKDNLYHTVLTPVFEEGFSPAGKKFIKCLNGKRYCFKLNNNMELKNILSSSFTMNRDLLGVIYKWLRKIVPGRNIWTDNRQLLQHCRDSSGTPINGFQLSLALEVFKELGFINMESGNQYIKILCNKNPVSRQLDESRLINYHRRWLAQYGISN